MLSPILLTFFNSISSHLLCLFFLTFLWLRELESCVCVCGCVFVCVGVCLGGCVCVCLCVCEYDPSSHLIIFTIELFFTELIFPVQHFPANYRELLRGQFRPLSLHFPTFHDPVTDIVSNFNNAMNNVWDVVLGIRTWGCRMAARWIHRARYSGPSSRWLFIFHPYNIGWLLMNKLMTSLAYT